MALIEAEEVSKSFGKTEALKDVSIKIEKGEIVGILGPNGAGKSTLMQILSGHTERDEGELEVLNRDPEENPAELREDIGVLPEREDPPSFLTGKEFLDFCADVRDEETVDAKWIKRLKIGDDLDKLTQDLSKGERQKLMIVQAFFHNPELVLIDEPLINLDPLVQEEAKDVFREHREKGNTVFLSTHVVPLAEEVCDRVIFLRDGRVVEEADEVENLRSKFLERE